MKKLTLIIPLMLVFFILVGAWGSSSNAAVLFTATPTVTGTPTLTATATRQPTVRPSATPTSLVAALFKQLIFGTEEFDPQLFNGVLPGCPLWKDLAPQVNKKPKLPYIYNAGRKWDTNQFCIYGLNADNGLEVKLTRPDGSQNETAELVSNSLGTFSTLSQGQPFPDRLTGFSIPSDPPALSLSLWLPAGMPTGKWQMTASTPDGAQANGAFKVGPSVPLPALGLTKPHVGVYPAKANPFNIPVVDKSCQPAAVGDTVTLFVVNLNANSDYVLGGYRLDPNDATKIVLADRIRFHTNAKGNQSINLELKQDMQPGEYHILLATNAAAKKWWDAGPSVCLDVQ